MSLTPKDKQAAHAKAMEQYRAQDPQGKGPADIGSDQVFQDFYHAELKAIETAKIPALPPPAPVTTRRDATTMKCAAKPRQASAKPCKFTVLQTNKPGSDRQYVSGGGGEAKLGIVSGHTRHRSTVQSRLSGVSISCPKHNGRVWNVSPMVPGTTLTNNAALDVKLRWTGSPKSLGILNHEVSPTTYKLSAITHELKESVEVEVYPDRKWAVSIEAEFGLRKEPWGLTCEPSISVSRQDDGATVQYGDTFEKIIERVSQFALIVNDVRSIAETVAGGWMPEFEITPPNFKLELSSGWEELDDLTCGYQTSIEFGGDPLIGVELEWSLGKAAIQAIPLVGGLLVRAAGSAIDRYIAITLSLEGEIAWSLSKKKPAAGDWEPVENEASGRIGITLSARGQLERNIPYWGINSITMSAKSGITIEPEEVKLGSGSFQAKVNVNFDGLVVEIRGTQRTGASRDEEEDAEEGEEEEAASPLEWSRVWMDERTLKTLEIKI